LPSVVLQNIIKIYDKNFIAVSIEKLEIRDGEFFVLLGPSGCGKTTTLRIIAGLIRPTQGRVFVSNRDITDLPPEKRNITMVFQNFALFPHMNVYENIAYGLRMRNMKEEDIRKRVQETAKLLRIENLLHRRIDHLSGGQQQRVGVARAIAPHPDIILFDEPLSNLDAKLREEVRFELKEVHKRIGTTAVYVTHDQAEAMVMADRIGIMNKGKIIQMGSPEEIYKRPKNLFVAGFIGIMTPLSVDVLEIKNEKNLIVKLETGEIVEVKGDVKKLGKAVLILRPETLELIEKDIKEDNIIKAKLLKKVYLGSEEEYRIELGGKEVRMKVKPHKYSYKIGEFVNVKIIKENSWVVQE